jgi:hypothetical protein
MDKVLLLSVLVTMVVLPLRAARARDPRKALRRVLAQFLTFNVLYWAAVVFIWFTLMHGSDARNLLHAVPDQ